MATIGNAELPIPGGGDSPTTPGHLAELAEAIDPHLWQHVTNLADRNARLSEAPLQTVAVAPDGTTWVKISATTNTWATLYEPLPAWQPLTLAAGYEAGQTLPEGRLYNGQVHLRGTIQRTDAQLISANGTKLATVPNAMIPEQLARYAAPSSMTGDAMVGACRMEVYSPDQDANAIGGRGSVVVWSQDGEQDEGTPGLAWVDISGSYWLD
ncbi:hypothetical protein [Streptomyces luteogriseus]|uniref:hypothetical protein n=1 Tax=Streptomyces luteogriseus TaxID=68233 RepID=UPI00381585E8